MYYSVIREEVLTGLRNNKSKKMNSFLSTYFRLPKEIEKEVEESGVEVLYTKGDLGNAWNTPNLEEHFIYEEDKKRLMEIAELLEDEPILSPGMMTVGIKG